MMGLEGGSEQSRKRALGTCLVTATQMALPEQCRAALLATHAADLHDGPSLGMVAMDVSARKCGVGERH